ncbi:MAG: hypothetical protein WBD38_09835, partial [Candidatus Dormiibacterota bacterium]
MLVATLSLATGMATYAPPAGGAGVAAAGPGPQPRLPGINAQFLPPTGNAAARSQAFDRIAGLGVRIARIDSVWSEIEKTKGVYNWSNLDAKVNEVVAHGLSPRVIIDYSNTL